MRAPLSDLPLVLENVSLRAGATPILDGLNLTVAPGAPTLIVGPNGAGKTSLLRLCMGLTTPSEGRVTWGGRTDRAPLSRAIVFQRPVMLRRSASANIAYALAQAGVPRRDRAHRVAELLNRVGLAGLAYRPARRLSSGEQRRLALARDPEILLLDEPTANLDPAATRAVEEIVQMAAQSGIKVVMASHDLGQVRRLAGEVIFLLRGRLLSDRGTWISFRNKGDLQIVVEGDKRLFNQYGVMLVNPEKYPHVKKEAGQAFIDWLISPEGQAAIASYKIEGQQLFFPDAK